MIIKFLETSTYKKGTARAKWFTAIMRYDNKPVDSFVEVTTKKPRGLNTNGEGESPMGWWRYYERSENIQVIE